MGITRQTLRLVELSLEDAEFLSVTSSMGSAHIFSIFLFLGLRFYIADLQNYGKAATFAARNFRRCNARTA